MVREICKWQMVGDREKRGFGKTRTRPTILVKRYSWKELWLQIYLLLTRDAKFILNVTVTFSEKMQIFFFFFFDKFDFNKTFSFNPGIN